MTRLRNRLVVAVFDAYGRLYFWLFDRHGRKRAAVEAVLVAYDKPLYALEIAERSGVSIHLVFDILTELQAAGAVRAQWVLTGDRPRRQFAWARS